jgi:hypothetical protein
MLDEQKALEGRFANVVNASRIAGDGFRLESGFTTTLELSP